MIASAALPSATDRAQPFRVGWWRAQRDRAAGLKRRLTHGQTADRAGGLGWPIGAAKALFFGES